MRASRLGALLTLGLAVVAVAAIARSSNRGSVARPAVAVLLANNHLLQIAASGRIEADVRLGPAPTRFATPGRFLASADGKLYVLVPGRQRARDRVLMLDRATYRVAARYTLAPGVEYRGLLATADGRLLVYGNRAGAVLERDPGIPPVRASTVVVTTVDLRARRATRTVAVHKPAGRNWFVYWGALGETGATLYLSYHGGCGPDSAGACTTGADMLSAKSARSPRCPNRHASNTGCIELAHGRIEAYGSHAIATTGSEALILVSRDGTVVARLHTGVTRTHLMDFALDRQAGRLYVDSCAGSGSLRVLDLRSRAVRTLARGIQCGQISTLVEPHLLVSGVAANENVTGGRNRLLFIDTDSGRLVHVVRIRAEPIALLA